MNRKLLYVFGGVLLVVFAGFSLSSFQKSLTPYVPYHQARTQSGTVQVAGALEQGSSSYDMEAERLLFTLRDDASGETMKVRYGGLKPANFEDAVSIVAIGQYDGEAGEFQAEKLLVKCPSKYQGEGAEVKEYS